MNVPDITLLSRRFAKREATVGIIGMGYVGLPLMLAATSAGFRVLGFDIDEPKVAALNHGKSRSSTSVTPRSQRHGGATGSRLRPRWPA